MKMVLEKCWLFYRDAIEEKPISTKKWTMIAPVLNPPHSEDMIEVTWNFFQSIWNVVALPTLWAKGSQGTSEHCQGGAQQDILKRQHLISLRGKQIITLRRLTFSTELFCASLQLSMLKQPSFQSPQSQKLEGHRSPRERGNKVSVSGVRFWEAVANPEWSI